MISGSCPQNTFNYEIDFSLSRTVLSTREALGKGAKVLFYGFVGEVQ